MYKLPTFLFLVIKCCWFLDLTCVTFMMPMIWSGQTEIKTVSDVKHDFFVTFELISVWGEIICDVMLLMPYYHLQMNLTVFFYLFPPVHTLHRTDEYLNSKNKLDFVFTNHIFHLAWIFIAVVLCSCTQRWEKKKKQNHSFQIISRRYSSSCLL